MWFPPTSDGDARMSIPMAQRAGPTEDLSQLTVMAFLAQYRETSAHHLLSNTLIWQLPAVTITISGILVAAMFVQATRLERPPFDRIRCPPRATRHPDSRPRAAPACTRSSGEVPEGRPRERRKRSAK